MNFIFDLHQTIQSQKLILVYQGDFTQETTKSILTMAERQTAMERVSIRNSIASSSSPVTVTTLVCAVPGSWSSVRVMVHVVSSSPPG